MLAQPIRRSILDRLRDGEPLVGERLAIAPLPRGIPSTSGCCARGVGDVRVDGPRRWYGLRVEPLAELDDWLAPYRWMWEARLDRLGAHLDTMSDDEGDPDVR